MTTTTTITLTIQYTSKVRTLAGWRNVRVLARAEQTSAKMVVVRKVIEIDGEAPRYVQALSASQSFNGKAWAARQLGAKKLLSSCEIAA